MALPDDEGYASAHSELRPDTHWKDGYHVLDFYMKTKEPNQSASGKGGFAQPFHIGRSRPALPERHRSA